MSDDIDRDGYIGDEPPDPCPEDEIPYTEE
jgi:hypothetical protein